MSEQNPREQIGANNPPTLPDLIAEARDELPERVTDYLRISYADRIKHANDLLARAREIPAEIETEEDAGKATSLIKEMRDLSRVLDTARETEKAPYLRSSQSADSFFFTIIDRIARRSKTNKAGAADVIQDRLHAYNQRRKAAEEERRRQEAVKAAEVARKAAQKAADDATAAEAARLAAERARRPETAAVKGAVADLAETMAAEAAAEAKIAAEKAAEARIETYAKPADMVRQRFEGGGMNTMAREAYAVIIDEALLDKDLLWPFIKIEAKEQALRGWAKTVNHNKTMDGAEIGWRDKTQVR